MWHWHSTNYYTIISICNYTDLRGLNKRVTSDIQCSSAGNHMNSWWVRSSKPDNNCLLFMFAFLAVITVRQEGSRAQPLKEWHSHWGHSINWLEPTRSKMMDKSTSTGPWASLYAHCITLAYAKWHILKCHDSSEVDHKRQKSGWWPNSWKSSPFPQYSWNNPPTH